ncbi:MAG: 3-dehydroquinate synthase [bacterium]|nr:3-dehydroquinate synthase [bacterium]
MAHYRIDVVSPDGTYPVWIQDGLLGAIRENPAVYHLARRAAIMTNTTLAPLYGDSLAAALPKASVIAVPDGEPYKTLDTMRTLYAAMVDAGLDRGSVVIALGGGVMGDMAGFAAATYMRGVDFVQIPTSLLAMVDSSVGGKVGVDLPQGKNLVGAFKQPKAVYIDPVALRTLPIREWRCGMAEVIKHGFLADPGLHDPALWEPARAADLIARAVQVKVDIVQADPFEQGIRAHLNLGHTFAHAIETVSAYRWLHGEAVGLGLVAAGRLSARIGLCEPALAEHVESVVGAVGLPTRMGDLSPDALYRVMATDKKWRDGRSRFVLLRGIGQPALVEGVEPPDVLAVLKSLQ